MEEKTEKLQYANENINTDSAFEVVLAKEKGHEQRKAIVSYSSPLRQLPSSYCLTIGAPEIEQSYQVLTHFKFLTSVVVVE